MKISTIAAAVMALCSTSQVLAESAGRVLALAGSGTIERAGQQLPLKPGVMVESGDVLAVGDASTLQVRFTDESVVALRANSQFKIENYQFNKNADTDRSLLGLLKGGMRTITGLIGKANQKNYLVQTPTATIGIRGTHFSVVSCNNDCNRPDGSKELNGTFGAVTDGRITVSNASGGREFGQQDYFHVPTANTPPVQLLVPPAILSDRSAPATRARSTAEANSETGGGSAQSNSGSGANTSTSPQLVVQASPSIQLTVPLTRFATADQPTIVSGAANGRISVVEVNSDFSSTCTTSCIRTSSRDYTLQELKLDINDVGIPKLFTDAASLAAELRAATRSSTDRFTLVGSSAAAAAYWGYSSPPSGSTSLLGNHVAFGDSPTVALPGSGTAQYNYVGGTSPTDNFGRVGSFSGGNGLLMDFGARQIKPLTNLTLSFGTNAQQATPTTYLLPSSATFSMSVGPQVWSGATCTNGCVGTTTGIVNGRFVGASAQGFISAVTVTNSQLSTGKANVAGAVSVFAKQ